MTVIQVRDKAHSEVGASGAYRWMACSGSVRLARTAVPLRKGSDTAFSRKGTAVHAMLEHMLESNLMPADLIDVEVRFSDGEVFKATAETLESVKAVSDLLDSFGPADWHFETEVHIPDIDDRLFGMLDIWGAPYGGDRIVVVDYKDGVGIEVEAAGNPQLYIYGLMALSVVDTPPAHIELVILQPNSLTGRAVRRVTLATSELISWRDAVLRPALAATLTSDKLVFGGHCRYCPARHICPEFRKEIDVDMTTRDKELTDAELAALVPKLTAVVSFLKDVKAELEFRMVREGREIPGFKVVRGPSARSWAVGSEKVLLGLLGPLIYTPPTVRTVAALTSSPEWGAAVNASKDVAERLEALVVKTPGGLTAAEDGDRRKKVEPPRPVAAVIDRTVQAQLEDL